MKNVKVCNLGLTNYKKAWRLQEILNARLANRKLAIRRNPDLSIPLNNHYLLFCEHPLVYTLGKSGKMENLLLSETELEEKSIDFYKINRGGDITHHGPGQLVMYPILDLEEFFTDIHKYLRFLEEAVIRTLAEYGVIAGRYEGYTGVWIEPENEKKARKICAMGIRCTRWITMHGIALNLNNDLNYFNHIVPCGIDDKAVTSLEKEIGKKVNIEDVQQKLTKHLIDIFEMKIS
jgi:lipoyl(octanoyl) transferase